MLRTQGQCIVQRQPKDGLIAIEVVDAGIWRAGDNPCGRKVPVDRTVP